jgi:diguanylate cyclase (GGDEF)-like protein
MDNFAFLLPVTMTLFGVVFVAIGWTGQPTSRAWGAAFILGAAGFVAPVLPLPAKLQALFANAMFLASFYYYGEALLRHFEARRYPTARVVFALIAYAAILFAIEGLHSLNLELTIGDISVTVLLGVPLAMVFGRAKTLVDRVLILVATVVVVDLVVRLLIFNVLIGINDDFANFASTTYAYYLQVNVGVLSVAFALAALGSIGYKTLDSYRFAAERDPLTGLLNRRGFDAAVARLPAHERENSVLVTCDIDNFKQVNDRFGHTAGDVVLSSLAELLRARLPIGSTIARFGGEEFVAVLPKVSLSAAAASAQSIRAEFAGRDWQFAGIDGTITLCFGIATASASNGSLDEALKRADRALYAAKAAGRNKVSIDAEELVEGIRMVSSRS